MKKIIILVLIFLAVMYYAENSKKVPSNFPPTTMTQSESDEKLIDACKSIDGVVEANITERTLIVKANISKIEAEKLSDGMLSEIKKYNLNINAVIVNGLDGQMIAFSH